MENPNALVADCIVISCCCQCLVLQVIIILLKLPYKMARKTRKYVQRKLERRRRRKERARTWTSPVRHREEMSEMESGSMRIESISMFDDVENCMDEVEKVMWELYVKGEFGFGSFCGSDERKGDCFEEFESHFVNYHLIEVIGPLTFSPC